MTSIKELLLVFLSDSSYLTSRDLIDDLYKFHYYKSLKKLYSKKHVCSLQHATIDQR